MENLGNFFSLTGEEKKKEKEKTKEIVGEVSLGDLFNTLSEEKKKVKEKSLEKEKVPFPFSQLLFKNTPVY